MGNDRNSARMGKSVEILVAASCILMSDHELNVSTSLVDDEGVDLVFHRRAHTATIAVQVKSSSLASKAMTNNSRLVANVGASTFRPRPDLYMLFVAADTTNGTYGPVWFVPSQVFKKLTKTNGKNRRVFTGSAKPKANDKWREFRCARAELPMRILDAIDSQPGGT